MPGLSAPDLIGVWEQGLALGSARRAVALLARARPDDPVDELAQLSVGRRDTELLSLREATFGRRLVAVLTCPGCLEPLEVPFDAEDVRVPGEAAEIPPEGLPLEAGDLEIRFRPPNSTDLMAAEERNDQGAARSELLQRCVISVRRGDQEVGVDALSPDAVDAVAEEMSRIDPQSDVQLTFVCPSCGERGEPPFDIASFLWAEVDMWARRLLSEVHVLASAYGWVEADILGMSPWRRQLYLDLLTE